MSGETDPPPLWTLGLLGLAIVGVLVGLNTSWSAWTVGDDEDQISVVFGLSEVEISGGFQFSCDYGEACIGFPTDSIATAFTITRVLVVLSLLAGLGALVLYSLPLAGVSLGADHESYAKWTAVAAAGLMLLAPLQIMIMLPGAISEDSGGDPGICDGTGDSPAESFWGSCEEQDAQASWGASTAWWFLLLAGLSATGARLLGWSPGPLRPSEVDEMTVEVGMAPGFER